jgi:hypothetical protein
MQVGGGGQRSVSIPSRYMREEKKGQGAAAQTFRGTFGHLAWVRRGGTLVAISYELRELETILELSARGANVYSVRIICISRVLVDGAGLQALLVKRK